MGVVLRLLLGEFLCEQSGRDNHMSESHEKHTSDYVIFQSVAQKQLVFIRHDETIEALLKEQEVGRGRSRGRNIGRTNGWVGGNKRSMYVWEKIERRLISVGCGEGERHGGNGRGSQGSGWVKGNKRRVDGGQR